jgi:KDO2-lipid IV(A) lauroyltransferase
LGLAEQLQYLPVRAALAAMGRLPRRPARRLGIAIAFAFYHLHRRLVRVGRTNLELAFPALAEAERERILRGVYRSLGRQMAEFCLFPRYRREQLAQVLAMDGLEHYQAALARGRGVIFLAAHFGAWELSSFGMSLAGHPMSFIIRPLDNQPLNSLVERIRGLHGNTGIGKHEFARGLLQAMQANHTVGILMDQNSAPPQGVFVPFFGHLACTAAGPAKIALKTGAAVVPAFALWEEKLQKYVLYFEPALELEKTGDEKQDVIRATAQFTAVIERWVRRYPDQWLWVHRRWKTRPAGEAPLY